MPLNAQPTKSDASIGRVKSDSRPLTNINTQVPAAEFERFKTVVIDIADEVGNHLGGGGFQNLNVRVDALETSTASVVSGSTGGTDNRILRADGSGGSTLQNSPVGLDDSGILTGVGGIASTVATGLANIISNVGGGFTALLRRSLLQFSGAEAAAVVVADVSAGAGVGLVVRAGNTTDAGQDGGTTTLIAGQAGAGGVDGIVAIGTSQTSVVQVGGTGKTVSFLGDVEIAEDCQIDGTVSINGELQVAQDLSVAGVILPRAPRVVAGTTDTPTPADHGRTVEFTSGSAITVTLDELTKGCTIKFRQVGAGQITLVGGTATIQIDPLFAAKTRGQHAWIAAEWGDDTTKVGVYGNLALAP